MNYDTIILELMNRVQVLEKKVESLEGQSHLLPVDEEEEDDFKVSAKYLELTKELMRNKKEERVCLSFSEIEDILGFELPASARQHRAFWANTETHSIALSWMSVDFETIDVDMEEEQVTFLNKKPDNTQNDYIFMKLGTAHDSDGNPLNEDETLDAYMRNMNENGLGYTWFSTASLYPGMAKKKVLYYNELIQSGEKVKMLFAVGGAVNDIKYSADIMEIVSEKNPVSCPGEEGTVPEEFEYEEKQRIWIKIENLKEDTNISANDLLIRTSKANVKDVISTSQWHFGYVFMPE